MSPSAGFRLQRGVAFKTPSAAKGLFAADGNLLTARAREYNSAVHDDLILALETSSPRGSVALGRISPPAETATGSGKAPCDLELLGARVLPTERRHTGELLPAIAELLTTAGLKPRDVGVVAFSQGPGSFTGLRVAATIARMWHSAVGSRVVGVPSLEVIARNVREAVAPVSDRCPVPQVSDLCERVWDSAGHERLGVIVDARSGRVFAACFERDSRGAGGGGDILTPRIPTALVELGPWLAALPRPCLLVGDGVAKYRDLIAAAGPGLQTAPDELACPDARQVLAIAARMASAGQFLQPHEIVPAYHRPPECEEVYEQRRAEAKAKRGEG